jgi:hypothetical protein
MQFADSAGLQYIVFTLSVQKHRGEPDTRDRHTNHTNRTPSKPTHPPTRAPDAPEPRTHARVAAIRTTHPSSAVLVTDAFGNLRFGIFTSNLSPLTD